VDFFVLVYHGGVVLVNETKSWFARWFRYSKKLYAVPS